MKGKISVRSKVWLEVDGAPFLGMGRLDILRAIDRSGSIVGAANDTGIPYRRIWGAIQDMERRIGYPMVLTRRGGRTGGGAWLTKKAQDLMNHFVRLQEGVDEEVDLKFRNVFSKCAGFF